MGKVALIGTPLQVIGTILWGVILGRLAGWTGLQGVWLGALLSHSSTTVVLRCLSQNGVLNTLSSRVVVAEMEGALEMVHQSLDQLGLKTPAREAFRQGIRQQHYAGLGASSEIRSLG